jgi:AraC-like DNA-binding protein
MESLACFPLFFYASIKTEASSEKYQNSYYGSEGLKTLSDKAIVNIAYECGFNSKSSFNTAFKKYTGMTPSTYRNQIRASAVEN